MLKDNEDITRYTQRVVKEAKRRKRTLRYGLNDHKKEITLTLSTKDLKQLVKLLLREVVDSDSIALEDVKLFDKLNDELKKHERKPKE